MKDKEFLQRYDANDAFSEDELLELLMDMEEVNVTYDKPSRWHIPTTVVFRMGERLFSLTYSKGATEGQEHYCDEQPIEVKETVEMVEVVRYVPVL